MVAGYQREIRTSDLTPQRSAELLLKLTALLGNCQAEIVDRDADYAGVLLALLMSGGKANRAKIEAETTPAYQYRQEARNTFVLVQELCRSLKYAINVATEEMRLSR
jgi:hypothetical protein